MTPEQFSSAWGLGLARTERAALLGVNIPEASRRFLMEAGLPPESECMCFGDAEEELPAAYRDFWPIGVDGATRICVQEETGRIYSVDADQAAIEFAEHLAAALRRADPAAMQSRRNYWPSVLEAGLI